MIRYFADHPTAANLLLLLFLGVGLLSAPGLKRETFPDFSADKVQVQIVYPRATAEEGQQFESARLVVDGKREETDLHYYVPRDYDPEAKSPLMLGLHGSGGEGTHQMGMWRRVADSIIVPRGTAISAAPAILTKKRSCATNR